MSALLRFAPMSCRAWGDESVRRDSESGAYRYLIGVFIQDEYSSDIAERLRAVKPSALPKLHWRDLRSAERERSIEAIARLRSMQLVLVTTPLEHVAEERARRKCLAALFRELDGYDGLDRLILESRTAQQDKRDRALFLRYRQRTKKGGFDIEHRSGQDAPELWVPDQVLGAYGDHLRGRDDHWSALRDQTIVTEIEI